MELGKILQEARQARGLSLEQVEKETKIRRRYLEALEKEAFDLLPGRVYVRGFLRTYARYLGLDAEALVARLEEMLPEEVEPVVRAIPGTGEKLRRLPLGRAVYIMAGMLLVFLLLWGGWWILGGSGHTAPDDRAGKQPAAFQGEQVNVPENRVSRDGDRANNKPDAPRPEDKSSEGVHLVLNVIDETCWMSVMVDGRTMFTGEVAASQSKSFQGRERIWIKLGNAGVVNVKVNGRDLGVLGKRGQVVSREFSAATLE
ncbi:helix-turn-helix domain-containing protein [Desulfofundulus thermocisternus]|uniref:helix-turn-helix domain-containing protein n=1 Tax=Desulfofundulus thermocisternus TaxID=42471 RepID=UPI0004824D32|nr:helix-turn-helix domain-containing protein [Desulfofundulus thermocisternus]